MSNKNEIKVNEKLQEKTQHFLNNIKSDIYFQSDLSSDGLSFEWLDEVEFACPYIDNLVRDPKVALITEENVLAIDKAKKVSVESVKDLAKNTHYIEKVDEITQDVQPSKILVINREETFNTYENRFIYTLIINLIRFVMKKEDQLKDLTTNDDRVLEYKSETDTKSERVNIQFKITTNELDNEDNKEELENEIQKIKDRIVKINQYITSWQRSEFMTSLEKARVPLVFPPIKKTNMILKNPNFQIAMKLWEYIYKFDLKDDLDTTTFEKTRDKQITSILDDAFLLNYFVIDSISTSKKEQREKLAEYAVIMLTQQVQRAVTLLLNSGVKVTDQDILALVSAELDNARKRRQAGAKEIEDKFKDEMGEYLERLSKY